MLDLLSPAVPIAIVAALAGSAIATEIGAVTFHDRAHPAARDLALQR